MARAKKAAAGKKKPAAKKTAARTQRTAASAAPSAPAPVLAADDGSRLKDMPKPFFRSLDVRALSYDELKPYALKMGVPKRDVESLSEDRLRQNTMLRIVDTFELHTGE
jgi:hypothetical protein